MLDSPLTSRVTSGVPSGVTHTLLADAIARLSVTEIQDAVAPPGTRGRQLLRAAASVLAGRPSARLGELLARFDGQIAQVGICRAARDVLASLGARLDVDGACPSSGPVLVAVNHPGAYDALATVAALGRDDIALVAADRPFLRAMPRLSEHLLFVPDSAGEGADGRARARARGVRLALDWLASGRVLVQFGAGAIEPDARFARDGDVLVGPWGEGTGWLALRGSKSGAAVVPCFVSGVHSPRAKRLFFVRWAEQRGITTIAPLLQATLPGFRDVVVSVRIGSPLSAESLARAPTHPERTAIIRDSVASLSAPRP